MKSKRCSKCREEKSIDRFSCSSDTPDRKQYWCKECNQQYAREQQRKIENRIHEEQERKKQVIIADREREREKMKAKLITLGLL